MEKILQPEGVISKREYILIRKKNLKVILQSQLRKDKCRQKRKPTKRGQKHPNDTQVYVKIKKRI